MDTQKVLEGVVAECKDEDWDKLSMGDLKFVVEENEIPVSKFILYKESSVFEKMLTSDFTEKNENKIKITDCTYSDMLVFVKVIHQLTKVDKDNVFIVLPNVHKYMCKVYLDQCTALLIEMANSEKLPTGEKNDTNCVLTKEMLDLLLKILIQAEIYDLSDVTATCVKRLEFAKISDIKNSQYFDSLEYRTYTTILENNLSKLEISSSSKYSKAPLHPLGVRVLPALTLPALGKAIRELKQLNLIESYNAP